MMHSFDMFPLFDMEVDRTSKGIHLSAGHVAGLTVVPSGRTVFMTRLTHKSTIACGFTACGAAAAATLLQQILIGWLLL